MRWSFPPFPSSFRGRARELRQLSTLIAADHPAALALIGAGGSGKTTLAIALGHRMRGFFGGRLAWLRIGAWDRGTVAQLMAAQLGAPGDDAPLRRIRRVLGKAPALVVLDNHEDDAVTAATLNDLQGLPVTWVITARRCLLGGVTVVPVVPALIARRENPFPAIAELTGLLRWHPVALDIADALVSKKRVSVARLEQRLLARGVRRIVPIDHEDDIPEVRAVVHEALRVVSPAGKRMLAVLASMGGDAMDSASLASLGRARDGAEELAALAELRLVQFTACQRAKPVGHSVDLLGLRPLRGLRPIRFPAEGRVTLHATVRHAIKKPASGVPSFDLDRYAAHYLDLFEREPARLAEEQTHLFALMDWAQERRDASTILRVQTLGNALA